MNLHRELYVCMTVLKISLDLTGPLSRGETSGAAAVDARDLADHLQLLQEQLNRPHLEVCLPPGPSALTAILTARHLVWSTAGTSTCRLASAGASCGLAHLF